MRLDKRKKNTGMPRVRRSLEATMNRESFKEAMAQARDSMISTADLQRIDTFRNSRLRPVGTRSVLSQHGTPLFTYRPLLYALLIALIAMYLCTAYLFVTHPAITGDRHKPMLSPLGHAQRVNVPMVADVGGEDTVKAAVEVGASPDKDGSFVAPALTVYNTTYINQVVRLEGEERCDAIRWVENGVHKARYNCEVSK